MIPYSSRMDITNYCPLLHQIAAVGSPTCVSALLATISVASLERCTVSTSPLHSIDTNAFSEILALTARFTFLEELRIDVSVTHWQELLSDFIVVGSDCLRPLTTLQNLRQISLYPVKTHVVLRPGALAELSKAWPSLELFCLDREIENRLDTEPNMKNPVIQELIALVGNCPDLVPIS